MKRAATYLAVAELAGFVAMIWWFRNHITYEQALKIYIGAFTITSVMASLCYARPRIGGNHPIDLNIRRGGDFFVRASAYFGLAVAVQGFVVIGAPEKNSGLNKQFFDWYVMPGIVIFSAAVFHVIWAIRCVSGFLLELPPKNPLLAPFTNEDADHTNEPREISQD